MQPRLRLTSGNGLKCTTCGVDIQRGKRGPAPKQCKVCAGRAAHLAKWKCPTCGKQCIGRASGQRYCSIQCRKTPERKTYTKACLYCGVEFETNKSSTKYCCSRHGVLDWDRKRSRPEYTCEWCAKPFYRKQKAKDQHRFCSRSCAFQFKRISGKYSYCEWKHCAGCGVPFLARSANDPFCSVDCSKTEPIIRKCPICHNNLSKGKQLCCACASANKRLSKKRSRKTCRVQRRARWANCIRATVTLKDVIGKHGIKCYLCGCNTDPNTTHQPNSATLEHVVPIALGGWHDLLNLRVACLRCNSLKGAEYSGQLMLTLSESMR